MFFAAHELTDLGDGAVSLRLVASRRPKRAMSIMHERYEPGADTGADMLRHQGEEGGIVVRGRIELTVGGESRTLGPGDAYYFSSAIPHRFRNAGTSRARSSRRAHRPPSERDTADRCRCRPQLALRPAPARVRSSRQTLVSGQ